MVKVIDTNATPAEQLVDWELIKRKHEQAVKADPLWEAFGGVIYIKDRWYQVVES